MSEGEGKLPTMVVAEAHNIGENNNWLGASVRTLIWRADTYHVPKQMFE